MSDVEIPPACETPVLVWDLPVRLFHLLFGLGFVGAFAIGQGVDDDSPLFPVHMLLGGTLAFMVLLRIGWGLWGPPHARFRAFLFGPAETLAYFRSALRGGGARYPGHNPGSAPAILAMLALTLGLALTGILMGQGSEAAEELHEGLAAAFAVVAGLHLAGVAWHSLRHRENLAASMLHGRKLAPPETPPSRPSPLAALAFLILTGAWAAGLVRSYEPTTRSLTLPLLDRPLRLGEGEHHEGHPRSGREWREHDD